MTISNELITKFAKLSKETKSENEQTVYGTTAIYDNKLYVVMDGSDILTPVTTTSEVIPGERVRVTIKDHTATITGNVTTPSASKNTTDAIEGDITLMNDKLGNFEVLIADKATVGELNAEVAKIQELIAIKADIKDLTAISADIKNLYVEVAEIDKAVISKAEIKDLEAAFAEIDILEAGLVEVETLIGGHLTMDNIQSLVLTSSKVTVDNAFIKDAMIDRISAGKINTGVLNTNLVQIGSEDGSLTLDGSLQQFKDSNGNVRIQIGKDASGDFTFVLYGEDGNGQLINQNGITASGIGDGLIIDRMIQENAGIQGSKLDINSVIKVINNDSRETILSTKIFLDEQNQSLEAAFNQLHTKVNDDLTEQIESSTTSLEVAQGQINSLIANTTITKDDGTVVQLKDEFNSTIDTIDSHEQLISNLETNYNSLTGEIETVNSTLVSTKQDLDGFKTTVTNNYYNKSDTDAIIEEKMESANITINPDQIISTVTSSKAWTDQETVIESMNSSIIQNADKIGWVIESGTSSSNMTLTNDALTIIANNIDLTGKVTFRCLASDVTEGIESTVGDVISTTIIDGANIKTGSITATQIASNTITANQIASGAISTDELAAGAVTANKIQTGTITADQIAGNTITANQIASGAISTDELAAGAVTAAKISSGAVSTDKLAAGAVTADKIESYCITADQIAANTITSAEIAAGAIKASELASGAVTADKIAAGAVTADKISARSISVDKLSSNNANPVITLFDQCELDASYLNGQGKGSAIRLKWDDENYVYQGNNIFALFQSSHPESKIFSVSADGNGTKLYNKDNYVLALDSSLTYRGSTVLTAGNYSSWCAPSSHSHSGYASSSHSHSGYASSSHTHSSIQSGSAFVDCYGSTMYIGAGSTVYMTSNFLPEYSNDCHCGSYNNYWDFVVGYNVCWISYGGKADGDEEGISESDVSYNFMKQFSKSKELKQQAMYGVATLDMLDEPEETDVIQNATLAKANAIYDYDDDGVNMFTKGNLLSETMAQSMETMINKIEALEAQVAELESRLSE